jgi:hypothetical protein
MEMPLFETGFSAEVICFISGDADSRLVRHVKIINTATEMEQAIPPSIP